jgi:hypothetical protein
MFENEPTIEETKAFATGLYQGAQVVSDYVKERWRLVEGVLPRSETGHRDACMKGLYGRVLAWMQTIVKLNDPLDFQALSIANRALLEITVDLILLHGDKTNSSGWRMHWWGESQKLKSAEQIINYYHANSLPVPDEYEAQVNFVRDSKASLDHMRRALWPNKKDPAKATHSSRWTGNPTLFEDIVTADKYYGTEVKADLGSTLVEYYRAEYPKMNWHIHSGVASFWNQPPQAYNLVSGFAFKWSSDFGMLCAKIVLSDFGFNEVLDDLGQEWENLRHQRDVMCFNQISTLAAAKS